MKFDKGDLVFDPRINMTGMIVAIEEKTTDRMSVQYRELWYRVMFFGDEWCNKGKTRDYTTRSGDDILERYKEEEHKGKLREEANHDINDISRVFINTTPYDEIP